MMIVSLVYKPADAESKPADHFSRVPLQSAELVVGHGIAGDKKGGHPTRQLNIMCQSTLDDLQVQGYHVQPGMMGEQIIVSGVDLGAMAVGDQLHVGDAIVEMTTRREGCIRFEAIQGRSNPTITQPGALGIMAKVVQGGTIALGDAVTVVKA